jgi:hypothetical protein
MRVFFKDVSNVSEITKEINKYKSDTYLLTVTDQDAIYIASDFPLNHFYIKMGSVLNSVNANMEVSYWSASGFSPVANLNDYTYSLSESGFVEFTPDREESWLREDTNSAGNSVDGLTSIKVYDQYWVKVKFDVSLTGAIELEWIGNKFSDDNDLFSEYPIFNDAAFLTAFESGKNDWEEQHVKAAELIIQDLKRKNVILGPEQILDRDTLMPAATAKVAELIYNAFGNDYRQQRIDAIAEYVKRIDLSKFIVDTNNNAIKDRVDITAVQGWLSR